MKATVVPAQVTTVEDRVAGNFGFSQLILFAIPIFGGSLLYAVLPPSMDVSLYKIIVICVMAVVAGILAIRIKGKIILFWLIILLRYNLRPKLYLFNKNSNNYRLDYPQAPTVTKPKTALTKQKTFAPLLELGFVEKAQLYATFDNPASRLRFKTTKKGGLNVRITEIQEQNQ
jgi:hypothetical protein